MKDIILKIERIQCTDSSNRIEKVLNNVEGVEKATVSFAEKEATITYNEEKISEEQIKSEIGEAGFKAE